MRDETKILSGNRIGVFGKGGSGKSTVVVLLAGALARRGYDVCVLDADSTNVGLHQALGLETPPASLLDHFGGMVFSGGAVTCPVDDPTPLSGADLSLNRLPGRYYARNQEGVVLLTAGKIGDQGPGAGCDGPVAKIARDLRIEGLGEHPVTLVDFKAGFEDSARGAVIGLDLVLVVIDPTQAGMQMAVHMKEMVRQLKAGAPPAVLHLEDPELAALARRLFKETTIKEVLFVLNRVEDAETERYLRRELAAAGIEPIGVIRRDPAIGKAWLRGTAVDGTVADEEADRMVKMLGRRMHASRPLPA